ncbi:hypothetical protein [Dysgonomonas macrotermitis]|uniref:Uncharacterized protein n=1 Tax=Dysgonomonas macrotermitis TaxID=1346286 RepID=A0A1M5IJA3_9BACT|nr:hypothetical protein [Dysgonomonas macrotermitis]SHG28345.1 hypothetical protein SAMN05444362_1209 [Dysgonomonas macrotermitis]
MKNEKNILKQNSLASGLIIKLGLGAALLGICVWCVAETGMSLLAVAGVYILVRSVLKIIRLAVGIIYSLLSILFLIAAISLIITFIL